MYMKSLKDFRRRSVEAVMVTVGASERTVDEDFELLHVKFENLCTTMNSSYASSIEASDHQKSNLEVTNDFSKLISKVYSEQLDTEVTSKWPQSSCALKKSSLSRKYSECCTSAHTIIGASCAAVYRDEGLEPFRNAAATMGPAVEETCKQRATMVTDFDSYRRRLKALEQKKLTVEQAGGKEEKINELNIEISKYYSKVKAAELAYNEFNEKTKGDIIENRVSHDALLDNLLVATIVCQAELHQRIASQLQQLVQLCPADQVARIRSMIDDHVNKGGPPIGREEAGSSSTTHKTYSRNTAPTTAAPAAATWSAGPNKAGGGVQPAAASAPRFEATNEPAPTFEDSPYDAPYKPSVYLPPPAQSTNPFAPPPAPVTTSIPFQNPPRRQFAVESKDYAPTTAPPPPVVSSNPFADPTPAPGRSEVDSARPMVVALYDHEADADDELNFSAGDYVEVLEAGEGGWWKGRCNGQVGLFPVNYVQALS